MKITDTIYVLPIIETERNHTCLNLTILINDDRYLLIDTGYLNNAKAIQTALEKEGLGEKKLAGIVLTHQDIDHIGSLPQLVHQHRNIPVFAYGEDAKAINGEIPFLKFPEDYQAALFALYPKTIVQEFQAFYDGSRQNVTNDLKGETKLSFGQDYRIIPTPGHTPGHISLYHAESQTLIAGDALIAENGKLFGPRKQVTPDYPEAIDSLQKFLDFPLQTIICYHGGIVSGEDLNEQVAKIIATSKSTNN